VLWDVFKLGAAPPALSPGEELDDAAAGEAEVVVSAGTLTLGAGPASGCSAASGRSRFPINTATAAPTNKINEPPPMPRTSDKGDVFTLAAGFARGLPGAKPPAMPPNLKGRCAPAPGNGESSGVKPRSPAKGSGVKSVVGGDPKGVSP
jgi:hypothetical protein